MPKSASYNFSSVAFLKTLEENLSDAVYLIDPETSNILWVNRAGYEDLQMDKDEVLHQSVLSLQEDIIGLSQWKCIAEVIKKVGKYTFNGHHIRKDKSSFPVEVNTSTFEQEGKTYFLSIARDISSRRQAEERADADGLDQRVPLAIDASSDGVWDWNLNTGYVHFSPSLKRMLGYGPDEMEPIVDSWKDNVHERDLPRVYQALEEHIDGKREKYDAVYRLRNRNGHYLWVHDVGAISKRDEDARPVNVTGIVRDITDYKAHEFRLMELAAYDELTELRNRRECTRVFDKQITLCQRNNDPLSACIFDLDHFKAVNDKYGHLAGDEVLKEVAILFSQLLRKSDYLFRWGGEEFVLLCPHTNKAEMMQICEKLRKALEAYTIKFEGEEINVTSSFGVATFPVNGETRQEIMLDADSALYYAKSKGRNRVSSS